MLTYSELYLTEYHPNEKIIQAQRELEALKDDYSQYYTIPLHSDKKLVILYEKDYEPLCRLDYNELYIPLSHVQSVEGRIGSYYVTTDIESQKNILEATYVIYCGQHTPFIELGILHTQKLETIKHTIIRRMSLTDYTKSILYSTEYCDFNACQHCYDVCPSDAIHTLSSKSLYFSPIDCTQCYACVSVCPTGSITSTQLTYEGIQAMINHCSEYKLLVTRECDLAYYKPEIVDNMLILTIDSYDILSQEILFYMVFKLQDNLVFINSEVLPTSVYGSLHAICKVFNRQIETFFSPFCDVLDAREEVNFSDKGNSLRWVISQAFLTSNEWSQEELHDENLHFHLLNVNENCTLCMGCAFICRQGAFSGNEAEQSLTLNNALCSGCQACITVCPEKAITLRPHTMMLTPSYFQPNTVAKDELFYCQECGKPFATQKVITKVSSIFLPLFTEEYKRKTLYCCSECKPKIMLEEHTKEYQRG